MDIIDTEHSLRGLTGGEMTRKVSCPGKGKHAQEAVVGERCFGLLMKVSVYNIGALGAFYNYKYVGPKNKALLYLALLYAKYNGIRVFVGGKIVTGNFLGEFDGEGLKNFEQIGGKAA